MKIPPVGAELFHADGRIDMTKLIVTFRNFVNAPVPWNSSGSDYVSAEMRPLIVLLSICETLSAYL